MITFAHEWFTTTTHLMSEAAKAAATIARRLQSPTTVADDVQPAGDGTPTVTGGHLTPTSELLEAAAFHVEGTYLAADLRDRAAQFRSYGD